MLWDPWSPRENGANQCTTEVADFARSSLVPRYFVPLAYTRPRPMFVRSYVRLCHLFEPFHAPRTFIAKSFLLAYKTSCIILLEFKYFAHSRTKQISYNDRFWMTIRLFLEEEEEYETIMEKKKKKKSSWKGYCSWRIKYLAGK